jgi:nitrite reductase/ring-hydroxylating ferredoxin subunit
MFLPTLLGGCAGATYIQGSIQDDSLIIPRSSFEIAKDNRVTYRGYVIAQHPTLKFPICVYRIREGLYHALWMRCTHQGNELQVFGDKLQCPAHGSEFTRTGAVQNGPADEPLRTFSVSESEDNLKIVLQ